MRIRAWLFIIAGVLAFIGGITGTQIIENTKTTSQSTFKVNPKPTVVIDGREYKTTYIPSDSLPRNENQAARNKMEDIVPVCYIAGVVCLGIGGILLFSNPAKKTGEIDPIMRQVGVILETESGGYQNSVIVEFEDYSRKKLLVGPSIVLVRGDRGVIGYQGDWIVEFQQMVSAEYRTM